MLPGIFPNNYPNEPAAIRVPTVNATHFYAITIMTQIQLEEVGRTKRDFGIKATVIVVIVLGVGGAVARTVPLTQMATTAETLNQVVAKSVEVLHAQETITNIFIRLYVYYNNKLIFWLKN